MATRVDGHRRYKGATFPAPRTLGTLPPEEAWAPGTTMSLQHLRREIENDVFGIVPLTTAQLAARAPFPVVVWGADELVRAWRRRRANRPGLQGPSDPGSAEAGAVA